MPSNPGLTSDLPGVTAGAIGLVSAFYVCTPARDRARIPPLQSPLFHALAAREGRGSAFADTVQTQAFSGNLDFWGKYLILLAPRAGFEPATIRLTVTGSSAAAMAGLDSPAGGRGCGKPSK